MYKSNLFHFPGKPNNVFQRYVTIVLSWDGPAYQVSESSGVKYTSLCIFALLDNVPEAKVTKVWTLAPIWNYHYFYIKPVFLLYCEQIKMNNKAFILIFVLSHKRNLSKIKMQQRKKSRYLDIRKLKTERCYCNRNLSQLRMIQNKTK